MNKIRVIDISRQISPREAVYPGNPEVKIEKLRTFVRDGSNLAAVFMGLHTATHLDAPSHYIRRAKTIDKTKLEKCVGWARVIAAGNLTEIGENMIKKIKPGAGEIILFKTKNSGQNPRKFNSNFAHLNESAARALVAAEVKGVGIDGPSIRRYKLRPDTVHPILLKAGLTVYEGLNLKGVLPGRYFFVGVPLKIEGAEASPVRAVLIK